MFKITMLAALLSASTALAATAQEFADPGTELSPGETATVPFLVPNGPEVPVALTVTEIEEGDIADLDGFELPPDYEGATPYYVRFEYENTGDEDLSSYEVSGFVALSDGGEALMPSITLGGATPFEPCRNVPPAQMANGDTHDGCILFLLPEGTELSGVGYRGNYRYEEGVDTEATFPIYYDPIVWMVEQSAPKSKGQVIAPKS